MKRATIVLLAIIIVGLVAITATYRLTNSRPDVRSLSVKTDGLEPVVAALVDSALAEARQKPESAAAWGKLGSVLMHYDFVREARQSFDRAENLAPDDPRWPYLHGVLLLTHDAEAAVAKLRRSVELAPTEPDMPRLRLAGFLSERGREDEAMRHFEILLKLHPDHPRASLGLARLYHQRGEFTRSINLLQPCLTNVHTMRRAHHLLAVVERALGNAAAADAAATRSATLAADRPWPDPFWDEAAAFRVGRKAMIENATTLMDAGHTPEAVALLKDAARLYPADDETWYLMGWALNQRGDAPEAEKALREHLRLSPHSPKGHAQLAVSLLNQKRYVEGIEVLEEALRLKSTWREIHFNLGYACAQLGRTNEAIGHLRNALSRDPSHVPTYTALAELLRRQGQKEKAREVLEQAAGLFPSDSRVQSALRRIAEP